MKIKRQVAIELMALVDGEVTGEEKERLERSLDADPRARAVVDRLRDGRAAAWLTDAMDRQASRGGADDIAEAVFMELAKTSRRVARPGRPSARSFSRLGGPGLVAGLAIAAGVTLVVAARQASLRARPLAVAGVSAVGSSSERASAAVLGADVLGGVELDEIDSPSHDVSVFEISGAASKLVASAQAPSSVVIWIEDEPGAK